jgi:hypothetical protein
MELVAIAVAALLASCLTLFSGFGLSTLLLPVFLTVVPPEAAVAQTAVVHLAGNLLKAGLFARYADRPTLLAFGLPALAAAFAGGLTLAGLAHLEPVLEYQALGRAMAVTPLKLVLAGLMLGFAVLEVVGDGLRLPRQALPLAGALSGFFGGLSGHQGAFRSPALLAAGLDKQAFIGTGVAIACLVDVARLSIYAWDLPGALSGHLGPLGVALVAALSGVWLGKRLMGKVTLAAIRLLVAGLLAAMALLLGSGVI